MSSVFTFNNIYVSKKRTPIAIPVAPVWTQKYCVVCSGTSLHYPVGTLIFMYVFNMQRPHSEFFSMPLLFIYLFVSLFIFLFICKMGFYYAALATLKFLGPK